MTAMHLESDAVAEGIAAIDLANSRVPGPMAQALLRQGAEEIRAGFHANDGDLVRTGLRRIPIALGLFDTGGFRGKGTDSVTAPREIAGDPLPDLLAEVRALLVTVL